MEVLQWNSILVLISVSVAGYFIFKSTLNKKSLPYGLFLLSLSFLGAANITYLIDSELNSVLKWFNMLSLVSVLSGLFAYVRESKPVFARFPLYLVFIPFVTPFFYPLVIETLVISNLLIGTYQVGAALVALMMLGTKQAKEGNHWLEISGLIIICFSIASRWLSNETFSANIELSEILMSIGIIIISKGIYDKNKLTHEQISK